MRIDLSSSVRKNAFLVGSGASLLLFFLLTCQAIAEHWLQQRQNVAGLERAARVQWLNAAAEERLGLMNMDPARGDFAAAEMHFRQALRINPHSSRAWLELADAYEAEGKDAQHEDAQHEDSQREAAIRHALAEDPNDTRVQWSAANLFIDSDLDRGLSLLRTVGENDSSYVPTAISVAVGASGNDIDKVMLAVPRRADDRVRLMQYLVDRNQGDAADRVWPTVLVATGALKPRDVFFYLDSLIDRRQPKRAYQAWIALAQRDAALRSDPSNLVSNGDFEGELLNGGFGWRFVPTTGVTATLDTSTFHSGTRSLELQIEGENVSDFGFSELVPVESGAHYHLSGWLHAEDLEAAHGVSISVTDAYSRGNLLVTDEALGSFPWREIDGDFTAPTDTQLVKVAMVRSVPIGRIRGKLWLDDLRIEKR